MRFLIGGIFLVSGFEKTTHPYQNFLYVIQSYEMISSPWDVWMAQTLPWLELFVGLFVVLGLWTRGALKAALVFFVMFITVVTQAIVRNLPVGDCGCFGELIHLPLQAVLTMDTTLAIVTAFLIKNHGQTASLSLDSWLDKKK